MVDNIRLTTVSSIEGWTRDDKYYLLQGLRAFRSYEIERIQEYVSSKTIQEVAMAINYYKKIASQHPVFETSVVNPKSFGKPRIPLTKWAKLLTDNMSLEELKTETCNAVRMIADLENMPEPNTVENIDFRKIYHIIANAIAGKTIVSDKISVSLLNKCIVETALSSKAFIKLSAYKFIVNSIDLSDKEVHSFPKLTDNQELTALRHLASQRRYNPLKVPEAFMKPSCDVILPDNEQDYAKLVTLN